MRYCKGCGFPVPYGKFLAWTSDGTIIGRDAARTRLVYIEVDELRSLYDGVSRLMNSPVDPLVYRAEKEVGKRFIKTLLPAFLAKAPRGKLIRPEAAIKATSKYIFNYMAGLGMGRAEVYEYHSGDHSRVLLMDPHSVPLIAGDGAGVFEFMERVGVQAGWQRIKADEYIVTIQKVSEEPPVEEEFALEEIQYRPGNVQMEKCTRCGVPIAVTGSIYLNFEKGILRHSKTGVRLVAMPVQSFNAVVRELSREFGAALPGLMEGLEQKYTREASNVRETVPPGSSILDMFNDFPWMGTGNPVRANLEGGKVVIAIDNPFHPGIVAGRVAGIYEAWTGSIVRTTWIEDVPGRVTVTLERVA